MAESASGTTLLVAPHRFSLDTPVSTPFPEDIAMRLDLTDLQVESFATATPIDALAPITSDTGQGGPESYCYVCYPTGNTDPACPKPYPETRDYPCTVYEVTCPACA